LWAIDDVQQVCVIVFVRRRKNNHKNKSECREQAEHNLQKSSLFVSVGSFCIAIMHSERSS
jgi:hypothetical protein